MAELTIGQLGERVGLRPSALRYYERVGLLPKAQRVSGQRRYGSDAEVWIAAIQVAQLAGFTVAEIKQLLHGFPRSAKPSERWQKLARKKLPEVEELIRRATRMKSLLLEGIRCNCSSLSDCAVVVQSAKRKARRSTRK